MEVAHDAGQSDHNDQSCSQDGVVFVTWRLETIGHERQHASNQQQGHEGVGELQEELDDLGLLFWWGQPVETMFLLSLLGLRMAAVSFVSAHTAPPAAQPAQAADQPRPSPAPSQGPYLGTGQAPAALYVLPVNLRSKAFSHLPRRQQVLIYVVCPPRRC